MSLEERFNDMMADRNRCVKTAHDQAREIKLFDARIAKLELRLRIYEKAFAAEEDSP